MTQKLRPAWHVCGWLFIAAALGAVFVSDAWDELLEQLCLALASMWLVLGVLIWAGQNPSPPT
jgi:hypothetical protein